MEPKRMHSRCPSKAWSWNSPSCLPIQNLGQCSKRMASLFMSNCSHSIPHPGIPENNPWGSSQNLYTPCCTNPVRKKMPAWATSNQVFCYMSLILEQENDTPHQCEKLNTATLLPLPSNSEYTSHNCLDVLKKVVGIRANLKKKVRAHLKTSSQESRILGTVSFQKKL